MNLTSGIDIGYICGISWRALDLTFNFDMVTLNFKILLGLIILLININTCLMNKMKLCHIIFCEG